jgi:hypothetical protein
MSIAVRVHYFRRRSSETVLEKLPGLGIVTRNRYGAEILNADTVMFLDWDVEPYNLYMFMPAPKGFLARLRQFIWGPTPEQYSANREAITDWMQQEKAKLEATVREKIESLNVGLRLYETRNGLRGIVTSSQFEPSDALAQDFMTYLGADKLYIRLCRLQSTFRARLTPKPWRIGMVERPPTKPAVDSAAVEVLQRWLTVYESRSARFATARFIAQIGTPASESTILEVIRLHDKRCKVGQNLELA